MRALRGAGPLRLRREKRALKRSEMGWVVSSNNSQRNLSVSFEEVKAASLDEAITKIVGGARLRLQKSEACLLCCVVL